MRSWGTVGDEPPGARDPLPRDYWNRVLSVLARHYEIGSWRTPVLRERGVDPYLVLVSTILSQRTRDEVTERVFRRFAERYPDSKSLGRATARTVEGVIHEVGLRQSKARALVGAARQIETRFGGQVPNTEEELRQLPGVGPKTARAVLVFGFQIPAIPVDAHIHRVTNRLGVVRTHTLEQTSDELAKIVPQSLWNLLNPVLVQHGQNICLSRAPRCTGCPIAKYCERVGIGYPALSGS
jgi:endonuclease III